MPDQDAPKKRRIYRDPDFGDIELPDEKISEDEREQALRKLHTGPRRRHWKPGTVYDCGVCGSHTLIGGDDIVEVIESHGRIHVFNNLRGARCTTCGATALENADIVVIEDQLELPYRRLRPNYEAKVSQLGSGSLGTYWPKDIQRLMGLKPGVRAHIEILSAKKVLVEFQDD